MGTGSSRSLSQRKGRLLPQAVGRSYLKDGRSRARRSDLGRNACREPNGDVEPRDVVNSTRLTEPRSKTTLAPFGRRNVVRFEFDLLQLAETGIEPLRVLHVTDEPAGFASPSSPRSATGRRHRTRRLPASPCFRHTWDARRSPLTICCTAASLNSRLNVRPPDSETPPSGGHATAKSEKLTLEVVRS